MTPMSDLNTRAWISLVVLEVVLAIVLFASAGTTRYWQGWAFLLMLFVMAAGITVDLMRRDRGLLERRMKGGPAAEPRPVQRFLMLGTSVGFLGLIVIPALDFRYQWSVVPLAAVVTGDVLVIVGFLLIARVFRENTFTSATVSIAEGQRVISSGPYAIVRHPMYAGALIYLVGTPLALGSYWGLLALLFMLPFLVWRVRDEEHLLVRELPGYADYCREVRYRLVPFVW
jgi:protein-S-isoprenylcysteine O-methyltransferase Ste14